MRLPTWIAREGEGAIARLAAATGLSYQTVHAHVRGKIREPKRWVVMLISAATGGEVAPDDLYPPRRRKRTRADRAAAA